MSRIFFLFLLVPLWREQAGAQSRAAGIKYSSAYTYLKDCKIPADEEGGLKMHCRPLGPYKVVVAYDGALAMISVNDSAGHTVARLGSDYIGIGMQREQVEWRMANGVPFAVIFKIGHFDTSGYASGNPYKAFNLAGSSWIVAGLPGCEAIGFTLRGNIPDAEKRIRRWLDEAFGK